MLQQQILNSKGTPIVLTAAELGIAEALQARLASNEYKNALGYEIPISTLTAISKQIVEQKYFQIAPADYFPVRVGFGAWSKEILTYRDYSLAGDFETGIINTGASDSKLAQADTGVDSVTVPIINWAKQINYSLFDLKLAAQSGNWDVVSSKERARKRNWDLGIQQIAFLGSKTVGAIKGLLTQSDVTANTVVITKYIKDMTEAEFQAFLRGVIEAYRVNAQRTTMPDRFIMPEADYNGCAVSVSESFPLKSKLERLLETFKLITQNAGFRILPNAYCDQVNNADVVGLNKNRYVLLRYDEDSIRMDIPVDYTNTLQNTINGFQFQNVGYGQFSGCKAYRPRETLYFDF